MKREHLELLRIGTVSSSPFSGSPTFDEVPFHVEAGRDPELGTFVLIAREENRSERVFHYGRIVQGIEENPKADPTRLQRGKAYGLEEAIETPRSGDLSPYVTRVARAELLGEVVLKDDCLCEVREARLLPQTGAPVYECPADFLPEILGLPSTAEGLHIGAIESGGQTTDFILPLETIARHIAVVGRTGVGKSYAAHVLVEEMVKKEIPVLSFDVLGDVVEMARTLGGLNLTAGEDFRVPFSVIGLSEFLGFVPNLTKDQTELVALAYDELFGRALEMLAEKGTVDLSLQVLLEEIQAVADAFGQSAVGSRAVRRVKAAVNRSSLLTEGLEDWPQELADRPVLNIYVGHLGQTGRNLIVGATARLLQILRRKEYIPPFMLLLDEAHLFLPGSGETTPSTHVIRELVRTARHDAIGIVLVTQSPASMDKQVLLTCNTRLVFALDREDLRLISGMLGNLPEEMVTRIAKLPKGTAMIASGMDLLRHPVQVRIRRRMTPEGAPTPDLAEEVRRWRERKNLKP